VPFTLKLYVGLAPPLVGVAVMVILVPLQTLFTEADMLTLAKTLGFTVKVLPLVPVPSGVVTTIRPVVPEPTVAVIWVAEFTVKEATAVPPIETAVAPVKLVPVITTEVEDAQPELGVKEVIVGGAPPPPNILANLFLPVALYEVKLPPIIIWPLACNAEQ
jgi:hypothetical protein